MDDLYFRKLANIIILSILVVLTYFLLKPILLAIIFGIVLAYIFNPVNKQIQRVIKSKNLSVALLSAILLTLIIVPIWYLTPIAIEQSLKIYNASQTLDLVTPFKKVFPSLFASEQFSTEVGSIVRSFIVKTANYVVNLFASLISDFVILGLKLIIVFFTFYFVLRDKDELLNYIHGLSPFPSELERKFFVKTKELTNAVLYGVVVVGIIQGIIAGTGFFIFGAPNAIILFFLAILAGTIPILTTAIIWIPVAVYVLSTGDTVSAIGISSFGLFSNIIDNFLRPFFISKKTKVHTALIIIGMIGGVILFGVLGFIIGPLILSYLLIILEFYRKKEVC